MICPHDRIAWAEPLTATLRERRSRCLECGLERSHTVCRSAAERLAGRTDSSGYIDEEGNGSGTARRCHATQALH